MFAKVPLLGHSRAGLLPHPSVISSECIINAEVLKKETKRGNSKIFVMYCEYSEDTIGSDMYMEPKYIV